MGHIPYFKERPVKALRIFAFVFGSLFAAGGAASAQTGQLEIDNSWARATPGSAETGAAYVTIRSPTADKLVAAPAPVAKKAELHTVSMEGMIMKMRPISGIDIPSDQTATLHPGGMHIMLIGLATPLKTGQTFPLTLTFEMAATRAVNVAVEKIGAMGPAPAVQH